MALLLAGLTAACSVPARKPAVPHADTETATVLGGLPNARFWADTQVPELAEEAVRAVDRERRHLGLGPSDRLPPANLLALSGGSDDGAFGAGLLVGWTAAGDRPEFKLVTGVSTGSLIAPFAFLGPAYDQQLREVYTAIRPSDVFRRRGYLEIPFDEAMSDTQPLLGLISRNANEQMLAAIAGEYAKGRLLLIGTTNLDVMRPIIWNIGAIAGSGHPDALRLFRSILLASSAVPAVFPPVLIDVSVDGHPYQEMHVDGGAVAQLFLYPPAIAASRNLRRGPLARERRAFIIRNARLDAEAVAVERSIFSIAGRAISSMIHYSGNSDILRLQLTAVRDGVDFNLAYIGEDFAVKHEDSFEPGLHAGPVRIWLPLGSGGLSLGEGTPALPGAGRPAMSRTEARPADHGADVVAIPRRPPADGCAVG